MKNSDYNQSNQRYQRPTDHSNISILASPLRKINHAYQSRRITYYQSCIFQPDNSNKQSYTRGNCKLHCIRYRTDNRLSQSHCCNHNKENSRDKYDYKRLIVGISHSQHNRICKKCIQSHTKRLGKWNLCI